MEIRNRFKKKPKATNKGIQHPRKMRAYKLPEGFALIQDTREQKPLFARKPKGLTVINRALKNGDYSIQGFEDQFFIERKGISDFFSYIGKERERTVEKLDNIKHFKFKALVIEADESDLLKEQQFSTIPPEVTRQALVTFEMRYGIHIYYSQKRTDIARWVLDRAIKFYNIQREV